MVENSVPKVPASFAASETLVSGPDTSRLGFLARRGVAWSVFQIGTRHTLGIGVTAVLARILTPEDYGLVGMVTTFTILLHTLADGGLSWATVQRKSLTSDQVHNMFWANAALGTLMWVLCFGAGPALAWFYERPELVPITLALGVSFLLTGLAVQPLALLQRKMAFGRRTVVELGSQVASAAVGITLALKGYGYWALVAQSVTMSAATLVIAFALAGYWPGRPRVAQGTAELLRFGGYLSMAGVVLYFARNFDNVLIGKFEGAGNLGLYTRAYFLMTLPTTLTFSTLSRVLVPAMSSIQDDRARLGNVYRRALTAVALFGFPVAAGLAVTAPEAVLLVYGPKWMALVPLVTLLSIGAIPNMAYMTSGWLFKASGRGREFFRWTAVMSAAFVGGFVLAIPFGTIGMAIAVTVVTLLTAGPGLAYAHRVADLDLRASMRWMPRILAATVAMAALALLAGWTADANGVGWLGVLAAKIVVGGVSYIALILLAIDVRTVLGSSSGQLPT